MEVAAETGSGSPVADSPEIEQADTPEGLVEGAVGEAADGTAEPQGGVSRVGRRWGIAVAATLAVAAAALAGGGCLALRDHRESQRIQVENAAAVEAAKQCVAATQVPAFPDLVDSERKILECATGVFYLQAMQNSGMFVQAFRAGQVHTELSEIRAAAERDNPDGSIEVLVAMRVKVDNVEVKGKEFGYRLRATMAPVDGIYRIANLQQVSR